jgi:hypothetical protein
MVKLKESPKKYGLGRLIFLIIIFNIIAGILYYNRDSNVSAVLLTIILLITTFFILKGIIKSSTGGSKMKSQVYEKLATLITAAFGLVAALAWNGAIQTIFKQIFGDSSTIAAMLIYAIVVTIIAVLATIWIAKVAEKHK